MEVWKTLKSFGNGNLSCTLSESNEVFRVQMKRDKEVIYDDRYPCIKEAWFNYEASVQEIEQWFDSH